MAAREVATMTLERRQDRDDRFIFGPPSGSRAGSTLGRYETPAGERELRALTLGDGVYVVDEGPDGVLLVEPRLEGMDQARALAADYLSVAQDYGEPQTRHPWPPREPTENDGIASAGRTA
jgi:hypothetical protein